MSTTSVLFGKQNNSRYSQAGARSNQSRCKWDKKKAFQSNVKRPLSDSLCLIVNKEGKRGKGRIQFEHVAEVGGLYRQGARAFFVQRTGELGPRPCTGTLPSVDRQNDRHTGLKTLPLPHRARIYLCYLRSRD